MNVGITGTANVSVSGVGNFGSAGKDIQLQSASFSVGKVTVPFVASIEVWGGRLEIGNATFTVTNGWTYPVPGLPKTLYTIPSSL